MKTLLHKTIIVFLVLGLVITFSCKKLINGDNHDIQFQEKPVYSTVEEFRQGLSKVLNLVQENRITAYLDTLPNGYPDIHGRKAYLAQFVSTILQKLEQNHVEAAVYDVFHFDEATFSLISYLLKAYYAGDISAQTLVNIVMAIPLPPIAVQGFQPPVIQVPVAVVDTPNCCDKCNPKIRIRVTWTYKPPCGNRVDTLSGYAAGNTLTHRSRGTIYRFDAEVTGCPCPGGVWTSKVQAPNGANYGVGGGGQSVWLLSESGGTFTITFTYKVCGKEVSQTFTITFD